MCDMCVLHHREVDGPDGEGGEIGCPSCKKPQPAGVPFCGDCKADMMCTPRQRMCHKCNRLQPSMSNKFCYGCTE